MIFVYIWFLFIKFYVKRVWFETAINWQKTCFQSCVYLASDGGRVCRPLVIADKGISRVKDHHMKELKVSVYVFILKRYRNVERELFLRILTYMLFQDGVIKFDDFLRDGLIEYLDVNEENNALVCSALITCSLSCLWNLIHNKQ